MPNLTHKLPKQLPNILCNILLSSLPLKMLLNTMFNQIIPEVLIQRLSKKSFLLQLLRQNNEDRRDIVVVFNQWSVLVNKFWLS